METARSSWSKETTAFFIGKHIYHSFSLRSLTLNLFSICFWGSVKKRTKRCVRLELKNFNCVCEEDKFVIWIVIGTILFMFDPLICILRKLWLILLEVIGASYPDSEWPDWAGGQTSRESRGPTPTPGLRSEALHRRRSLLWRPETARFWCCCTAAGNTKSQESCVCPQSNSNNM